MKCIFDGGVRLEDVIVYIFDNVDEWICRINVLCVEFKNGYWEFYDVRIFEIDCLGIEYEIFKLRMILIKEKI